MPYRFVEHHGDRLAYREWGSGPQTTVLLPGLLLSQKMQWPLAEALARRGNRVITLDPLGHGASDRPVDMRCYSMPQLAEQVVTLLDHLGEDEAVVGGTSLGANITLEVAALAPERLRGMLVEMPVLDRALVACAVAFSPPMVLFTVGEPVARRAAWAVRRIPRAGLPLLAEVVFDALGQEPGPSGAVLRGLFFGRTAPPEVLRRTFAAPTLVIGHRRDPIHPFSDADALARELPAGRLLDANSILELRTAPERLTGAIADFVDECWDREASAAA